MPNNSTSGDSLPAKRTKTSARRKMPSKAQLAVLECLRPRRAHTDGVSGDVYGFPGEKLGKFRFGVVVRCKMFGWLYFSSGYGYILTPAGREVLKQMEVK